MGRIGQKTVTPSREIENSFGSLQYEVVMHQSQPHPSLSIWIAFKKLTRYQMRPQHSQVEANFRHFAYEHLQLFSRWNGIC
jgi:hypothetical protein